MYVQANAQVMRDWIAPLYIQRYIHTFHSDSKFGSLLERRVMILIGKQVV